MKRVMTIGEAASGAGVNPRTLRYYERVGLLVPAARSSAGYRLYSALDAARLAFIRRAQATGLSLAEIAAILAVRDAGIAPCRPAPPRPRRSASPSRTARRPPLDLPPGWKPDTPVIRGRSVT